MQDDRGKFYEQYQKRKGWYGDTDKTNFGERFEKELKRADIREGARVLEIGFGDGRFLDWAKDSGLQIEGIEINPDFCDSARKKGHTVYCSPPAEILQTLSNSYDAVVMFDVLEHLTIEEVIELLTALKPKLTTDGVIISRFPNGQSPFGRVYQHGDATHRAILSGSIFEDLALLIGMSVQGIYNSVRPLPDKTKWIRRTLKKCVYFARDIVEYSICRLYFDVRIPLDPNITVVLKKP